MKFSVSHDFGRVAIIAHVYYTSLWDELSTSINIITAYPHDLFITLPPTNKYLTKRIKAQYPHAVIRILENRGYDIGPFIDTINSLNLDNYKYIVKLHTKRDVTERFLCWINGRHHHGNTWRRELLMFCSTASAFVTTLLRLESDPSIGMATSESLIIREDDIFERIYPETPAAARAFIQTCGLTMGKAEFVAGTMFIARASLFKPIKSRFSIDDFPSTNDKRHNGPVAYMLERALGYLVGAQGMRIADFKKDCFLQKPLHIYYRTRLKILRFFAGRHP